MVACWHPLPASSWPLTTATWNLGPENPLRGLSNSAKNWMGLVPNIILSAAEIARCCDESGLWLCLEAQVAVAMVP